jgi:hypothetical protein
MVGSVDIASVLHGCLARYIDNTAATRRVRPTPRYILGLIPQTSNRLDPAMATAIQERIQAVQARAHDVLTQAVAAHQPWVAALGTRPADPQAAHRWDQAALAVAAYRDTWAVTTGEPLGDPSTLVQRQDAAHLQTMLRTLAPHGADAAVPRPVPSASVSL